LLETNWCFWYVGSHELPPFANEAEMREAWRAHRAGLLADWCLPWRRPYAFWLYDVGVKWMSGPPQR
jgi:hypothetical protein